MRDTSILSSCDRTSKFIEAVRGHVADEAASKATRAQVGHRILADAEGIMDGVKEIIAEAKAMTKRTREGVEAE